MYNFKFKLSFKCNSTQVIWLQDQISKLYVTITIKVKYLKA